MAAKDSPGYLSTFLKAGAVATFHFPNNYVLEFRPKRKSMRTKMPACTVILYKQSTKVGVWDFNDYDKFLPAIKVIMSLITADNWSAPATPDTNEGQAWS